VDQRTVVNDGLAGKQLGRDEVALQLVLNKIERPSHDTAPARRIDE
jgi:hypothetical protein